MIPIALDPRHSRLGIAGNGSRALRRLELLRRGGAEHVPVFADAASPELAQEAGTDLRPLPEPAELAALQVLWIADLDPEAAAALARAAREAGVLVSTEDRPEDCDFHSVAEIRRKDLLLTVSTGGAAPGLAGVIRQHLETRFGPEWADRVDEVAALRAACREEGLSMTETARRIAELTGERCWLAEP